MLERFTLPITSAMGINVKYRKIQMMKQYKYSLGKETIIYLGPTMRTFTS